jgi:hypothetical protein
MIRLVENRGVDDIHFFYKGELIGDSHPAPIQCDEFEDLMYEDRKVLQGVLDYMNSIGASSWENDTIDTVDIHDLYFWFMREIGYQYDDFGEVYIDDIPNVEIFTGEIAE